jgi:hypothetical protein
MRVPSRDRKVPVIVRPSYTVSLESTSGLTFIHCDVHSKWTPETARALKRDWRVFTFLHEAPIYALHDPADIKHEKFLKQFGFTYSGEFQSDDGLQHIYKI